MYRSAAKEELDSQLASMNGGIVGTTENEWKAYVCTSWLKKISLTPQSFVTPWSSPTESP